MLVDRLLPEKGQSKFLKERGKVRAVSEACVFSTLQEDTDKAHEEELMENDR